MGRTLTEFEFKTAARQFYNYSQQLLDSWELVETSSTNAVYLKKQWKQSLNLSIDFNTEEIECDEIHIQDVSIVMPADDLPLYNCEYHIVYSISYQVPVLYFNIYKSGKEHTFIELRRTLNNFFQMEPC